MTRVLLLGGTGILGTSLQRSRPSDVSLRAPGRAELDLTDVAAVERTII